MLFTYIVRPFQARSFFLARNSFCKVNLNPTGSGIDRLDSVRGHHVLGGVRTVSRKFDGDGELRICCLGTHRVGDGRGFYRDPMLHRVSTNDRQFAFA